MTWHDYLHHSIDILDILTPIVGPLRHQQERFYTRDSSSGITCTCDTRTPTHRVLCPEIEPPALQHILAYPRTLEAIASSTVKSSFQHPSALKRPLVAEPKAHKWDSFASSFNPCPLETIANWNASTTFKYQCGCFHPGRPQLTSFKHSRQQIARRSIRVFFIFEENNILASVLMIHEDVSTSGLPLSPIPWSSPFSSGQLQPILAGCFPDFAKFFSVVFTPGFPFYLKKVSRA